MRREERGRDSDSLAAEAKLRSVGKCPRKFPVPAFPARGRRPMAPCARPGARDVGSDSLPEVPFCLYEMGQAEPPSSAFSGPASSLNYVTDVKALRKVPSIAQIRGRLVFPVLPIIYSVSPLK